MATANKKLKKVTDSQSRNNNSNKDVAMDRISELHESLILHILSFLPTKCAVSTTVLSKRWNDLWVYLPVLDFREWQTITHDHRESETNGFIDFLERKLFTNNESTIQKFCLNCDNPHFNENRVKEWITDLITRKLEELILSVRFSGPKPVTLDLFTCESLTTLDLNLVNNRILDLPQSISLPRLKVLRLSRVEFKDTASIQKLLPNCPMLEELSLCQCSGEDVVSFSAPRLKYFTLQGFLKVEINAPSLLSIKFSCVEFKDQALIQKLLSNCPMLEELVLCQCSGKEVISFSAPRLKYFTLQSSVKLDINAPSLVSIKFGGYLPEDFPVGSFPSLVEADFRDSCYKATTARDSYLKLVKMCSNIKLLKASVKCLEIFVKSAPPISPPTFENLTHLEVNSYEPHCPQTSITSLFKFLRFTPNLESLVINQVNGNMFKIPTPPHCLSHRLKSIEFQNFNGSLKEMELVKLFLKHARVLKQMIITREASTNAQLISDQGIILELVRLPRASKNCVFKISRQNFHHLP